MTHRHKTQGHTTHSLSPRLTCLLLVRVHTPHSTQLAAPTSQLTLRRLCHGCAPRCRPPGGTHHHSALPPAAAAWRWHAHATGADISPSTFLLRCATGVLPEDRAAERFFREYGHRRRLPGRRRRLPPPAGRGRRRRRWCGDQDAACAHPDGRRALCHLRGHCNGARLYFILQVKVGMLACISRAMRISFYASYLVIGAILVLCYMDLARMAFLSDE